MFLEIIHLKEINFFAKLDSYYIPYRTLPDYLLKQLEIEGNDVHVDREHSIIIASGKAIEKVR